MPDQQQIILLKQNTIEWNKWREKYPEIQVNLVKADLENANLSETDLNGAKLSQANLTLSDLRGTNLREANLSGANLSGANLSGADLTRADLSGADLGGANLSGAKLNQVNFMVSDLRGADLHGANLSKADLSETDLSGANLSEANLMLAEFRGANLSNTDLHKADLRGAKLQANLSDADLSDANLSDANLSDANLRGANLRGANLNNANLVRANLTNANLTGCLIYGTSAWDVQLEGAVQINLIITRDNTPSVAVDNLEVGQLIHMLLKNKFRGALNAIMKKGVLLLGHFSEGGIDLLHAVATKLREMDYLPMIFDFEVPDNRDYIETVQTLAGLSRFAIVDLSGPSTPHEFYALVPHFQIPFVPIIKTGRKEFSAFSNLQRYHWVLPIVRFTHEEQLLELLPTKVIEPAEKKIQEIEEEMQNMQEDVQKMQNLFKENEK